MKAQSLDADLRDELDVLISLLERRPPSISQPRLRHRFQTDVVGLDRSRHRLVSVGRALELELDDHAHDLPQVLGAVYAAAQFPRARDRRCSGFCGARCDGRAATTRALIEYLSGDTAGVLRRHRTRSGRSTSSASRRDAFPPPPESSAGSARSCAAPTPITARRSTTPASVSAISPRPSASCSPRRDAAEANGRAGARSSTPGASADRNQSALVAIDERLVGRGRRRRAHRSSRTAWRPQGAR